MTASKILAHHLKDLTDDDRAEIKRLLRRDLETEDVHVVFAPGTLMTTLEISAGNREFYTAGLSIQQADGVEALVFDTQSGERVSIDPADYQGDDARGLDLGVFNQMEPLVVDVRHKGGELRMKIHFFARDCPAIEHGSREDLAFRVRGRCLYTAFHALRSRGPSGDDDLDALLELLPSHLPMLRTPS